MAYLLLATIAVFTGCILVILNKLNAIEKELAFHRTPRNDAAIGGTIGMTFPQFEELQEQQKKALEYYASHCDGGTRVAEEALAKSVKP